jgi:anthranilate phosphoribosyltransferase
VTTEETREAFLPEAIRALGGGRDLSAAEAEAAVTEVMAARATPAQIGAFLAALAAKGETTEEVVGAARAMRAHAVRVETAARPLLDTCGTGGDGRMTFNISTAAAFVAAGAGARVAKHGNRSATSRCGSAEVLEAMGVRLEVTPEEVAQALEQVGIAFLFAPRFHPALRHAAPVRKEIGVPTIFNLLGPLTNPAGAERQLVGVARPERLRLVAEALAALGSERSLVVHGAGGVDELTLAGPSEAFLVADGKVQPFVVDPGALGLPAAEVAALSGGDVADNRRLLEGILRGQIAGPRRDVVLLNAAAALVAAGRAEDFREGLALARASVDSGAAWAKLEGYRAFLGERVA